MKFSKLLNEAQFHGAKPLGDKTFGHYWAAALSCLLMASTWSLYATISRFIDRPTFLVKNKSVNVNMEFPCLRMCPEIAFPDHNIDNFLSKIHIPSSVNRSYLRRILPQLAAFHTLDMTYSTQDLIILETVLAANNITAEDANEQLTSSCDESILRCRWKGEMQNCSEIFRMELTNVGFCCVFNGRSLFREYKEYGRHNGIPKPYLFTNEAGAINNGLIVALNQSQSMKNVDLDYKWVSVQQGQSYVDINANGTPLVPGQEYWLGYEMRGFQLSRGIRVFGSSLLQCRDMFEEPLTYFPVYRKSYCNIECEISEIQRHCGCIRPQHPSIPGSRHCRAQQLDCMRHAGLSLTFCNCPMTCTSNNFEIHTSSYPLLSTSQTFDSFYDGLDLSRVSVVRLYHVELYTQVFERRSYFTLLDLFSQFGGIFSLYFGCSVLTLLEVILLLKYCFFRTSKKHVVKPEGRIQITEVRPKMSEDKIVKNRHFQAAIKKGVRFR